MVVSEAKIIVLDKRGVSGQKPESCPPDLTKQMVNLRTCTDSNLLASKTGPC